MRHRWWIVGGCILFATVVGFQQAEPLEELRKYGSLSQSVGGVGPDDYIFTIDDMAAHRFAESLAVLARCKSVRGLFVPKMDDLRDAVARIAKLEQVTWLCMRGIQANDDDVSALAGMKNLQFLDLSRNPNVTDAGVAALAGLESLRHLNLTSTNVTGTGLKDRADMVSLEQLKLKDCPVTDESLAAVPRFPKLTLLHLGGTQVTDTGLMGLVGWHSLQQVFWSDRMTIDGQHAFNAAFLATRRKAREAGVPMDPRDIPPIFFNGPREPR